jgi:uncharacterized protein (TIGR02145 family)
MNSQSIFLSVSILLFSISAKAQKTGSFTDPRDNISYKTVEIGTQIWMAENLNYNIAYSWCYNDSVENCKTFGRLYTWSAAKKVCPTGWHLSTEEEWKTLITYLGGEFSAGSKLKSALHWQGTKTEPTDSIGFTGQPGGFRNDDGSFNYKGFIGYWWTTKEYDTYAYYYYLHYKRNSIFSTLSWKQNGLSVRCIKD